jgi:hypothetical protein
MPKSPQTDVAQLNQQYRNSLMAEASAEFDVQLPSLIRQIEIWSGRLAMFSLTTMLVVIAVKPL